MWKKGKKILSIVAAATCLSTAFAFAGCGAEVYKGDKLDGYTTPTEAPAKNGGFAVEYGNYVYFINGAEDYTVENKYGDVVKGALMRISRSDLDNGNYSNTQTVVPMLFVAQNFDAGIYIYGDYVYYATPTTDKNMKGEVENSWIDFKRAKLDGSETMKDYYFRLSNNASKYRFVEVDNTVYCLYEEDSALKSYNTATKETTVLVSGAKSSFFYDTKDASNPNVYYTMAVKYDADSANSTTAAYDQLYSVRADATVEKVDSDKASYTVKGGKTYDFNEEYLKSQNEEAKKNETDEPYDLKDYTTYPYVNLGNLVLDGIGSNAANSGKWTQFNDDKETTPATPDGYNYTISSYQNGGVYFTRAEIVKTSSDAESTKLYYLSDANGATINSVSGNVDEEKVQVVAQNTTNASASAIFYINEGVHEYLYLSNNTLYKANSAEGELNAIPLAYNLSSATLWMIDGDYLYYYGSGTNGNNLSRIKYTGTREDYSPNFLAEEEYQPITVAYVDWNSSWYKPVLLGDTLLYSNAQSFGSVSYNYVYAAKLDNIKAQNEAYEAVQDYIGEYSSNKNTQNLIQYYFRTDGKMDEAVEKLYDEELLEEVRGKFAADGELKKETSFISLVGEIKADDQTAIAEAWADSLLSEEEEVEEEKFPVWAICLIVAGSVLVVAAAVTIPLVIVSKKRKAQQAEEAEATVMAYKHKIDTTDDKTIDVYADDTTEETTEETVEEPKEVDASIEAEEVSEEVETTEEVSEEVSEETTEETTAEETVTEVTEEEQKED